MFTPTALVGVLEKRLNMKIKNDVIQEPLQIYVTEMLYTQLREIDRLTRNEAVSTLADTNQKYLIINRCVHPNLYLISYEESSSSEKEIVITERDLYES